MTEVLVRTCLKCEHVLDQAAKDRYDRWRRLAKLEAAPDKWPRLCAVCILKSIDAIGPTDALK